VNCAVQDVMLRKLGLRRLQKLPMLIGMGGEIELHPTTAGDLAGKLLSRIL